MPRIDEKTPLLPISVKRYHVDTTISSSDDKSAWEPKKLSRKECALLAVIVSLAGVVVWILNLSFKNNTRVLCRLGLDQLARVLPLCLYIGTPSCIVFLIIAPFVVAAEDVRFHRCGAVFCYLLCSLCAAWTVGASGQEGNSCR